MFIVPIHLPVSAVTPKLLPVHISVCALDPWSNINAFEDPSPHICRCYKILQNKRKMLFSFILKDFVTAMDVWRWVLPGINVGPWVHCMDPNHESLPFSLSLKWVFDSMMFRMTDQCMYIQQCTLSLHPRYTEINNLKK